MASGNTFKGLVGPQKSSPPSHILRFVAVGTHPAIVGCIVASRLRKGIDLVRNWRGWILAPRGNEAMSNHRQQQSYS